MTNTWFIAETNWNDHTTMSNEKIRELINTWNKVVQTHDTVYHLGNVFGDNKFSYEFQKELNGYKILRKGTLDHSSINRDWTLYFDEVYDEDILHEGQLCLSHQPLDEITSLKLVNNGFIIGNVFGQTIDSTKSLDLSRYLCVSAKQNGFIPIHINEIKKHFSIDESHISFFNR